MKNKTLAICTLSILMWASSSAYSYFFCSPNWYLAGSSSYVWHTNHHFPDSNRFFPLGNVRTYKYGGGANISLGYIFEDYYKLWDLRFEGEIVYKRNALRHVKKRLRAVGRTQDIALMANFITDIPVWDCIDLNIGAGVGISFNELRLASIHGFPVFPHLKSDEFFACQILCGITYNLFPDVALTAGYRLFATQKVKTPKGFKCKDIPLTQSLDFGMRFRL